jgi:hypothetical protein
LPIALTGIGYQWHHGGPYFRSATLEKISMNDTQTNWHDEYHFWHKIISEEVDRLRFNQGFEPVQIDLYPVDKGEFDFLGETLVGHLRFKASAKWTRDQKGRKILRINVLKA